MQIRSGKTRVVLLTRDIAIKIAKPRPLKTLKRLMKAIFLWPLVEKRLPTYEIARDTRIRMIYHYLRMTFFEGVTANRQEYRLSRAHPEYPLAPVFDSYYQGWIIVQLRGHKLPAEASARLRMPFLGTNLGQAKHVCEIAGQPCFFDYGTRDAQIILAAVFQ